MSRGRCNQHELGVHRDDNEWSPKLSAEEEAKRKYTIYGRASLEPGEEWHSPTNALDRFFTVGVEMK